MSASEIVSVAWNNAYFLHAAGVGRGVYVEQITYMIFLKMAGERGQAGQQVQVPGEFNFAKKLG
jgi:type I restriction enzyme M protein